MAQRRKILFKINDEVVVEETRDLYPNQIDEMKWIIASECECTYDDVAVEFEEVKDELSDDIDVSDNGLIFSSALYHTPINGVYCSLKEGSDEYLDAILDGTIENYLNFFV